MRLQNRLYVIDLIWRTLHMQSSKFKTLQMAAEPQYVSCFCYVIVLAVTLDTATIFFCFLKFIISALCMPVISVSVKVL